MKNTILFSFFSLTVLGIKAQHKISVDSANKHIGDSVTICSTVFGVKATDKLTFINLGAEYPLSPLTIVILAKDNINFKIPPTELYANKKICVSGKIEDYKGKTEIVVTKPDEIIIQ